MFECVAEAYQPQVVLVLMVFNDNPANAQGLGADPAAPSFWRMLIPDPEKRAMELDYSERLKELEIMEAKCRAAGRQLMVASFRNNARGEEAWTEMLQTTCSPATTSFSTTRGSAFRSSTSSAVS